MDRVSASLALLLATLALGCAAPSTDDDGGTTESAATIKEGEGRDYARDGGSCSLHLYRVSEHWFSKDEIDFGIACKVNGVSTEILRAAAKQTTLHEYQYAAARPCLVTLRYTGAADVDQIEVTRLGCGDAHRAIDGIYAFEGRSIGE